LDCIAEGTTATVAVLLRREFMSLDNLEEEREKSFARPFYVSAVTAAGKPRSIMGAKPECQLSEPSISD